MKDLITSRFSTLLIALSACVVVVGAGIGGGHSPAANPADFSAGSVDVFADFDRTALIDTSFNSDLAASLDLVAIQSEDVSEKSRLLYLDGELLEGVLKNVGMFGDIVFTSYLNGLKHGLEHSFYEGGEPKHVRIWQDGKRNGIFASYWLDGSAKQISSYKNDILEGELEEWFVTGIKAREFSYELGKEEGRQVMWYEDGTIRANYVVRNGRRYGSIGTKGCTSE